MARYLVRNDNDKSSLITDKNKAQIYELAKDTVKYRIEEDVEDDVVEQPKEAPSAQEPSTAEQITTAVFPQTMQATKEGSQFPVVSGIKDVASLPARLLYGTAEATGESKPFSTAESGKSFLDQLGKSMSQPEEEKGLAKQMITDPYNVLFAGSGGALANVGAKVGSQLPKVGTAIKHAVPALGEAGLYSGLQTAEQATTGQEVTPMKNIGEGLMAGTLSGVGGLTAEKIGKGLVRGGTKQGMKELGIKPSLRKKTENVDKFVDQYMRGEAPEEIGGELSKIANARNDLLDETGVNYGEDELYRIGEDAKAKLRYDFSNNSKNLPKGVFSSMDDLDKAMKSINDAIEMEKIKFYSSEKEFIKPSEMLGIRANLDEKIGYNTAKEDKPLAIGAKYLRKSIDSDVYANLAGEGVEKAKKFDQFLGDRIPLQKLTDVDDIEGISGYSTDVLGDVGESIAGGNVGGVAGLVRDIATGSGKKRRSIGALMQPQPTKEFIQSNPQLFQGLQVPDIVAERANIQYPESLYKRGFLGGLTKGATKASLYNQLTGEK